MATLPKKKRSKGKGTPPGSEKIVGNTESPDPTSMQPLNFRVPVEFHREFKAYAAVRGMKMTELLRKSFDAYKERHGS